MSTWTDFLAIYERRHGPLPVPVLIGILPLQSHRHAEFLYNEVPGIRPTESARERMRLAGSQGRSEGVKIAQELLLEARDMVHGVYIMPSFGRYEMAASVLDALAHRELTAALPGS
jgi:methionine synthase / methylenetetrahydrofolate reductase (NADH)